MPSIANTFKRGIEHKHGEVEGLSPSYELENSTISQNFNLNLSNRSVNVSKLSAMVNDNTIYEEAKKSHQRHKQNNDFSSLIKMDKVQSVIKNKTANVTAYRPKDVEIEVEGVEL